MDASALQIATSILNGLLQGLTTLLGLFLSLQFLLFQISPYYSRNIYRNNLRRTLFIFLFTLSILITASILPIINPSINVMIAVILLSFVPFVVTIVFFVRFNKFLDVHQVHEDIMKIEDNRKQNIGILIDIAIHHLNNNDFCMFKHVYEDIIHMLIKCKGNIDKDITKHLIRLSAHLVSTGHLEEIEEISFILVNLVIKESYAEGIVEVIRYQIEVTKMVLRSDKEMTQIYLERINILYKMLYKVTQPQMIKIPLDILDDIIDLYLLVIISMEESLYLKHLKTLFNEYIHPESIKIEESNFPQEDIEIIKLKLEYFTKVLENNLDRTTLSNIEKLKNSIDKLAKKRIHS